MRYLVNRFALAGSLVALALASSACVGTPGPAGAQGPPGPTGPTGPTGAGGQETAEGPGPIRPCGACVYHKGSKQLEGSLVVGFDKYPVKNMTLILLKNDLVTVLDTITGLKPTVGFGGNRVDQPIATNAAPANIGNTAKMTFLNSANVVVSQTIDVVAD